MRTSGPELVSKRTQTPISHELRILFSIAHLAATPPFSSIYMALVDLFIYVKEIFAHGYVNSNLPRHLNPSTRFPKAPP